MKATLISATAEQLDALRKAVEAEGIEVVRVLVRKDAQPLAALLPDLAGDLLVLEGTGPHPLQDIEALESLGAHGGPAVVLMTRQRDTDLLLAAMRAGVHDVLPLPAPPAELKAALHRITARVPASAQAGRRGRVIAFMPCKGGSGSTLLATNLAYLLATEQKRKTALIDLDLQYGDASYMLTDGHGKSNIADLAGQVGRLDADLLAASMVRIHEYLGLLAAPEDPGAALAINADQLARVLEVAATSHEFVVIDLQRMLDAVAIRALDIADQVYLVMENMMPVVRDARRLVNMLRALGYPEQKLRLVVNRVDRHAALTQDQIEKAVGLKVFLTLPDGDGDVIEAVNTGVALAQVDPRNPVTRVLKKLAGELAERPSGAASHWLGRLMGTHA